MPRGALNPRGIAFNIVAGESGGPFNQTLIWVLYAFPVVLYVPSDPVERFVAEQTAV